MIGTRGSAAVRYELARSRSGNRTLRDMLKEETYRREAKVSPIGVRLPSNIDTYNPYSTYHNVLAWCLMRRGNLRRKERRFLVSAYLAWGTLYTGRNTIRKAREVIALLDLYEQWWNMGSNMLSRSERLKTLDPLCMNLRHVRQLTSWVQTAMIRVGWLESSYFDPEKGDFTCK